MEVINHDVAGFQCSQQSPLLITKFVGNNITLGGGGLKNENVQPYTLYTEFCPPVSSVLPSLVWLPVDLKRFSSAKLIYVCKSLIHKSTTMQ